MKHVDLPPKLNPCPECNGPVFIPDVPLGAVVCKFCDFRYTPITKAVITSAWNEEQARRKAEQAKINNDAYLIQLLGVPND